MTQFILEAVNTISTYTKAFQELVAAVEQIRKDHQSTSRDNYPTFPWIAGRFKQLYNIPHIEKALQQGEITNPTVVEEYQKMIALKDIAVKYGFVSGGDKKYSMTNFGSGFLQFVSRNFEKLKSLASQFRDVNYSENEEWYKKLPEDQKEIVDIYKELTPKSYSFLFGLLNKQINKKNYMDYIYSTLNKDETTIHQLQEMKLLNDDYTLNVPLVKKVVDFLNDQTSARMEDFNKDIKYVVRRMSADKALIKNMLERNIDRSSFRRTETAKSADDIVDSLDDNEKTWLKNSYARNRNIPLKAQTASKFKDLGILDNTNRVTELGKYVQVLLTKLDQNASLSATGEKGTQYSRLKKSDIGGDINSNTRRNQRAGTRKTAFADFLNKR